ncbi:MAG: CDP-alcohol phosphatidyltransferase family protein [Hyphomicrobiaceae bacterium]
MNIPNLITICRAVLVPLIFWLLITGRAQTAFFFFVVAGISDALDGFLAKKFSWQTELGAHLDPLADKLLIVSVFIALGVLGELPSWLVVAVVSRDILIVLGVLVAWLLSRPLKIQPLTVSKANTAAQIILAATVLADVGFGLGLAEFRVIMVWTTAILTLLSLGAYVWAWLAHMSDPHESDA